MITLAIHGPDSSLARAKPGNGARIKILCTSRTCGCFHTVTRTLGYCYSNPNTNVPGLICCYDRLGTNQKSMQLIMLQVASNWERFNSPIYFTRTNLLDLLGASYSLDDIGVFGLEDWCVECPWEYLGGHDSQSSLLMDAGLSLKNRTMFDSWDLNLGYIDIMIMVIYIILYYNSSHVWILWFTIQMFYIRMF